MNRILGIYSVYLRPLYVLYSYMDPLGYCFCLCLNSYSLRDWGFWERRDISGNLSEKCCEEVKKNGCFILFGPRDLGLMFPI